MTQPCLQVGNLGGTTRGVGGVAAGDRITSGSVFRSASRMRRRRMRIKSLQTHDSGLFCRIAAEVSHILGSLAAFGVALGIVIAWRISGPLFGYSDTWQLVINTGTTIVTFLMVFLIQNTQN